MSCVTCVRLSGKGAGLAGQHYNAGRWFEPPVSTYLYVGNLAPFSSDFPHAASLRWLDVSSNAWTEQR